MSINSRTVIHTVGYYTAMKMDTHKCNIEPKKPDKRIHTV